MYEDNEQMSDQDIVFDFCKQVDLYVGPSDTNLERIVSICDEHGFRGIVVRSSNLEKLSKLIISSASEVAAICQIDAPFGESSKDIRAYSIKSAKEKGAKEVEVYAPHQLVINEEYKAIYDDLANLIASAKMVNIPMRYIINAGNNINDNSITKFCRIVESSKLEHIGFNICGKKLSYSDSILQMRNFKTKTGAKIKTYIENCTQEELTSAIKAGSDTIGIHWKDAANTVHEYEYQVQKTL